MSATPKKPPLQLPDFVDMSTWAQADQYLAKALLESRRLCDRIDKAQRKTAKKLPISRKSLDAIEGEALLIRQCVAEAATLRGLKSFGERGEICSFDAARHELTDETKARKRKPDLKVEIKAPGIIAMHNTAENIMIRAQATVVKKSTKAPKRANPARKK